MVSNQNENKPPALAADDVELAGRLRALIVPLARQLQRQVTSEFTPTQRSVLGAVHRYGPIRLTELAARERLSTPRVSTVITDLEAAGLVARFDDLDDARASLVSTTADGVRWIEVSRATSDAWLASRISGISRTERAAVEVAIAVLAQLADDVG